MRKLFFLKYFSLHFIQKLEFSSKKKSERWKESGNIFHKFWGKSFEIKFGRKQYYKHFHVWRLSSSIFLRFINLVFPSRIFTLYSKSLPLDVACRVWDVFCRDGEESLFRTALGILRLFEDILLQMDFIHIAQFLSRLPDDLQSHTLFAAMANTHMVSRNRRWAQVSSTLRQHGKLF